MTGGSGPTESDLLLNVARPGNDVADLQALRAFYARQIKWLEARKKLTEAQKEKLRGLYGDIAGVQAQLDAIEEEAARKREEAARKRAERWRKAQEALARHNREAEEHERKILRGGAPRPGRGSAQVGSGTGKGFVSRAGARASGEKMLTQGEVRAQIHDLLAGLHGVVSGFGSNIAEGSMGQVATQAFAQTQIMRSIDRRIAVANSGMWHPGARTMSSELMVAGFGVGF